MILVRTIGRVLVCLFIVGGYGAGDIAQANDLEEKGREVIGGIRQAGGFIKWLTQEGGYISVKGGISTAVDGTINFPNFEYPTGEAEGDPLDGSVNTKMSPVYLVSLGGKQKWGRIETEASYRENKIRDFNFKQPMRQIQGEGGSLENIAVMVNLLYEIKIESITKLRPYLLGGVGVSYVKYTEEKFLGTFGFGFEPVKYAEEKFTFAYQGGAGIRYHIIQGLNLDISYRWFGTPEVEFGYREGEGIEEEASLTFKNTHHTGLVGLVIDF